MSRLSPITYRIRPATNEDAAAVRALVFSTLAEFKLPALPETTDADLYDLEASYFQTGGTFEVAVRPDGRIVGCAGLCLLGDGRAELRKLYLRPEVRRIGLEDLLLQRMVQKGRELGCKEIRLETNHVLRVLRGSMSGTASRRSHRNNRPCGAARHSPLSLAKGIPRIFRPGGRWPTRVSSGREARKRACRGNSAWARR